MAQIEIKKLKDLPEGEFEVTVSGNTVTKHKVTLTRAYYEKLTAGAGLADALIEKSFEFLLTREPNTSILPEFNLTVISKYFSEYEREMKGKSRLEFEIPFGPVHMCLPVHGVWPPRGSTLQA